jgi:PEP-CTERM motif
MYAKRWIPTATVMALLFITGTALAGSIDFGFSGQDSKSTWTWGGGTGTLNATADNLSLGTVGGDGSALTTALITFTSGPATGGAGTLTNPYTFGPSSADSITITGCLPGSGSGCSPVTLFVGQFLQGEAAYTSAGNLDFDGIDVSGTINPALDAMFGYTSSNVTGSLDAILVCSAGFYDGCMGGFNGLVASGNMVLNPGSSGPPPTPEPSALFLLGSGLCGLTFYLRRRPKR